MVPSFINLSIDEHTEYSPERNCGWEFAEEEEEVQAISEYRVQFDQFFRPITIAGGDSWELLFL
jgi:hypothetical protein